MPEICWNKSSHFDDGSLYSYSLLCNSYAPIIFNRSWDVAIKTTPSALKAVNLIDFYSLSFLLWTAALFSTTLSSPLLFYMMQEHITALKLLLPATQNHISHGRYIVTTFREASTLITTTLNFLGYSFISSLTSLHRYLPTPSSLSSLFDSRIFLSLDYLQLRSYGLCHLLSLIPLNVWAYMYVSFSFFFLFFFQMLNVISKWTFYYSHTFHYCLIFINLPLS